MSYAGNIAAIPLGLGTLHSDNPQTKVPFTDMIQAMNTRVINGSVQKDRGSVRFNPDFPLPASIYGVFDWWPDENTQRTIAVCNDGKVYRFKNGFTDFSEVTPDGVDTPAELVVTPQVKLVSGGNEETNNPKKLFIFSGSRPVQIIEADGTTRRNIDPGTADWTNNFHPDFGIVHRSRMCAFGNLNDPHRFYISSATDHEDFTVSVSVYPGEGQRLINAFIYRTKLFALKYPTGLFQLVDDDTDSANWYFAKINDGFGAISQNASAPGLDDAFVSNSNGSISSVKAVETLGDVESGDILASLQSERFMRSEVKTSDRDFRHLIYYPDAKLLIGSYRSRSSTTGDRLIYVDFKELQRPRITWSNKDRVNCLALRQAGNQVLRPFYGSDDGYIYLMDRKDRIVEGSDDPYEMIYQTPYIDFSHLDPALKETEKKFDFFEITYTSTGKFDLSVDIYVDDSFVGNKIVTLKTQTAFDSALCDIDKTETDAPKSERIPISAQGRRISFKMSSSADYENFELDQITVYFKPAGQAQKS